MAYTNIGPVRLLVRNPSHPRSEAGNERLNPPKGDDLGESKRGQRESLFFPQNKASPRAIDVKVLYALSARATGKLSEDLKNDH